MEYEFDNLQFSGELPIFVQVVQHIKRKIIAGELADGAELPSRRKLAVKLGINPNTVQKIYKQLEEEGLLANSQGAKSALCISPETLHALKAEMIRETLAKTIALLQESGITRAEFLEMTTALWEKED